jgi:hypothetical protein
MAQAQSTTTLLEIAAKLKQEHTSPHVHVLPQGHAYMHTGQHDTPRVQCKYSSCAQFKRDWLP